MRLVLDASAAIRVLMRAESASQLLDHISAVAVVAAPSRYGSEVANALWKYVKAGSLELETALERYEEVIALIDDFTADQDLATEALAESVRYQHPVYDLMYAVLARRKACALLTMDSRLMGLLAQMGIRAIQA
jgi:predicted nucleic acid-binding protein